MTRKYTSSHWGSYEVVGTGAAAELRPLDSDREPARIGRGWLSALRNADARIARPSIREGWLRGRDRARSGRARFVEVPWDEALDLLGDELNRIIAAQGNGAIYAGSYGWASAGRFHHAQSQMRRFLNGIGGHVGAANTYSHAAAEVMFPYIVGQSNKAFQDTATSWPVIAEHCELIVAFGGISTRTAQLTSSGTTEHEVGPWLATCRDRGVDFVGISPRQGDLAAHLAAEWIMPRPGTDVALILGLAHEIFALGRADRSFLARCCHGAEAFEAYVTGADGTAKTPAWAAEICDVPEAAIRALARRMTEKRTMIAMTWSMQRMDHGEHTLWAGIALAAILGQIGQPGTGFGFGYGSTVPVGRPKRMIDWPSVAQGRNRVSDFIPVARITDMLESPGGSYTYDGQTRTYPDARMVWWSGGNPFHHHQDLNRLARAWQRPETVVVLDHSWTATARHADIVLPTTTSLEREDFMVNRRDAGLVFMSAAMPPFAGARDDYAIYADLAHRTGTHDAFTEGRSATDWTRALWEECRAVARSDGFDLPDYEGFRAAGVLGVPGADAPVVQLEAFVRDPEGRPLGTQSGRIDLWSDRLATFDLADCPAHPAWIEPAEWLGRAAPGDLHLISGQPDTRLHSQCDMGSESQTAKVQGREACALHPDAAAARGLAAGDVVLIGNARGACLAGLTLDAGLRPDCLWLPTGAWLDVQQIGGRAICVHGNPNVLTLDKGASGLSQANIAHTALVQVSKWTGPLPEVRVARPPDFT